MKHTTAIGHRKHPMAVVKRGETYHWRRMINGQIFTRSTRTSDRRLAGQLVAQWEAEALKEVLVDGRKPVLVHAAIDAFLRSRKGTGGYSNACVHMSWWKRLLKKPLKSIELHELQAIVAARKEAGAAPPNSSMTSQRGHCFCSKG
jgi:hypothetical protein